MQLPVNLSELSPMMKQYVSIKREYPDVILFYRLGDFYEMFFEDAEVASAELDLVMTKRDCGQGQRAPMCGVPHHSSEGYIAKLIKKGYKVAVCEQVEDPKLTKGIVKREVIRVLTPGTVTDSSMLTEENNNYISVIYVKNDSFGMCFSDISTGIINVTEGKLDYSVILNELARFSPKEILMNETAYKNSELLKFINKNISALSEQLYDSYFQPESSENNLKELEVEENFKITDKLRNGCGITALNALLKYIRETYKQGTTRITKLNIYSCTEFLSISPESRRNLELTESMRNQQKRGSLLWAIDKTVNSMGKRLLRSFLEKPLTDVSIINERLDAVEELYTNTVDLIKLKDSLSRICDIERLMTRVIYKSCSPRDLVALVAASKELKEIKEKGSVFSGSLLITAVDNIDTLELLSEIISSAIVDEPPAQLKDGGYIKSSYHTEIDELREILHNSRNYLSRMENEVREKTGIKSAKIGYNRVFGYYIEVSRSYIDQVPDSFVRKQTLASGERYITDELKQLESKILGANERLDVLEREIFESLRLQVEANLLRIQRSADSVALLDVLCCFATLGTENSYVRPIVDNSGVISIKNGRHPVVEQINRGNELFVPNDTFLDNKENLIKIITGPNMSGKSTYMRQTALIVILAQMGCFVPAREAQIGVVDAVFTRIGASDDLFSGDSTFMIEMKEIAYIFEKATKKSLLILDEVGRGTSTYDGMSIARAVIEKIADSKGLKAKTMFATHYHEITVMDREFSCIKNYNIAAKKRGDDIIFLRRIVHGPADDSYGIEVAKLAGVPEGVIVRAKEILENIEHQRGYVRSSNSIDEENINNDSVVQRLKGLNLESITPIEAMFELMELTNLANKKE